MPSPYFHLHLHLSLPHRGISLNSFVVGLAYVSGMCSSYSVNLVEDFGSLPAVASTTAHELGHLFSMQHDNSMMFSKAQPSSHPLMHLPFSSIPYSQLQLCTANGMHHVSSARLCSPWSSCSVNSITTALSTTSLGSCLTNVPTTTVGAPKCGNEGNETCDCGSPQVSSHQCYVQALQILCACYAHQHAYAQGVFFFFSRQQGDKARILQ